MTACLQTILLRMAQADLQLVQTVVDDERIDRSEHIHPQDERRLVIELPAIEYEHVAVGYVDANELQRPTVIGGARMVSPDATSNVTPSISDLLVSRAL